MHSSSTKLLFIPLLFALLMKVLFHICCFEGHAAFQIENIFKTILVIALLDGNIWLCSLSTETASIFQFITLNLTYPNET